MTLVKWIYQGPGRGKTAKDLDSLYRAVHPRIKYPLGKEIFDHWNDKRLKSKRTLEKKREG